MKETGFELSREKTYFIFLYNRENPKNLPQIELDDQLLNNKKYKCGMEWWGGGGEDLITKLS